MVREAIILPAELKKVEGNTEQRDLLLIERLGFSYNDLAQLRMGEYFDRIIYATQILSQKGLDTEIKQSTLTAIVSEEWNRNAHRGSKVATEISKIYKERRKILERETGLKITNIHLLREEFGNYSGNLIDAKRVWHNFQAGHCDWLRSVRIPTEIDTVVAMLLGVYWADGSIFTSDNKIYLELDGSHKDIDFYESVVGPCVEQVHHIIESVFLTPIKYKVGSSWKPFSRNYPRFKIGSRAIATWLRDDLGFSEDRGKPQVELETDLKKAFLSGLIAGKGSINNQRELYIHSRFLSYIQDVYELLRDCGFKSRINEKSLSDGVKNYQIAISPRVLREMNEENLLIHPERGYHPPSIDSRTSAFRKNQILSFIKNHEHSHGRGLKALEISNELGLNLSSIYQYLAEMKKSGQLCLANYIYFSTKS